jgi:hypothetical protein
MIGQTVEVFGPGEVGVVTFVVLVTAHVQRDKFKWQLSSASLRVKIDYVAIWLQVPT